MSKKINIKFSKELKIVDLSSEMLYNIEEVKDRADKQLKEKKDNGYKFIQNGLETHKYRVSHLYEMCRGITQDSSRSQWI